MTHQNLIKILALIAVVAFVCVCAMFYLKNMKSNATYAFSKTYSDFSTTWTDMNSTVTSESKTKYYDEHGSVKYILNTKTDFNSTVNDSILKTYCKCTAEYNNQTVMQDSQTDTTFSDSIISTEAIKKSVDELSKKCIDECIKYGAEQFFGKK